MNKIIKAQQDGTFIDIKTQDNDSLIDALLTARNNKKVWDDLEKNLRTELVSRFKEGKVKDLKTGDTDFKVTTRVNEKFLEEAFIEAIKNDDEFKNLKDLIVTETVEKINFDLLEDKITLGEIDGSSLDQFNEVKAPTYVLNTKQIKKD